MLLANDQAAGMTCLPGHEDEFIAFGEVMLLRSSVGMDGVPASESCFDVGKPCESAAS